MKPEFVYIHRNILASWVFADPQYFHVLTYLILQADPETGVVKNSQVDMAKYLRIPRATLQRIIAKLEDKGTVKTLKVGKQIGSITICNYARYQGLGKSTRASKNATTKERTEEEKKSLPPHPLIEEKKEKRKKDPAVAVNFSNVKLTHTIGGASLSSKMPAAAPTFNDRRQAFWNECQRYATRYSEEMLRNFFLYWSETNSRKPDKMRFEKEKTFQVGLRLLKWKHNGKSEAAKP